MSAESKITEPDPANSDSPNRGPAWLKLLNQLQCCLLVAWLAYACFIPANVYHLLALVVLLPLWLICIAAGAWMWVKQTGPRRLAISLIAALPIVCVIMFGLSKLVDLPVVEGEYGVILLVSTLAIYPFWWLGRSLLRATAPNPDNKVRIRPLDVFLLTLAILLISQVAFLLFALMNEASVDWIINILGDGWYENSLNSTLIAVGVFAVVAFPYSVFGLVRRSRHLGMMLSLLLSLVTLLIGVFAFFVLLAILAMG